MTWREVTKEFHHFCRTTCVVSFEMFLTTYCRRCHRLRSEHGAGTKCLFNATYFTPFSAVALREYRFFDRTHDQLTVEERENFWLRVVP